MDIQQALQFSNDKPATLVVGHSDKQQTIVIGLQKGQVLKRHISATPAMIVVLKGVILFEMEGEVTVINELNSFDIPPTVPHEVTGQQESIFLVIKDKA
jgi:quercetin dioxygenase-like cupin family protein